jgi:putative nucleotidyltransferase with HDIG domain
VGTNAHLARRFFGSLRPGGPSARDAQWVQSVLSSEEHALWQRMSGPDRRHSAQVARAVQRALGDDAPTEVLAAALLHDVGKRHTPLAILNKPGRLDDAERKKMEQHTVVGAAMLFERRGVPDVAPIVAYEHHANVDGTGYPRLRRNPKPHLASQIVHVADVFDALRTNRPYRAAMDDAAVRGILLQGAGNSFDASLLDLFLERIISPKKTPAPPPPRRISA